MAKEGKHPGGRPTVAKEGKHPGGRPKGSGKGKRGQARPGAPRVYRNPKKPCPDLARPDHDANCALCGGTGEVPNK